MKFMKVKEKNKRYQKNMGITLIALVLQLLWYSFITIYKIKLNKDNIYNVYRKHKGSIEFKF